MQGKASRMLPKPSATFTLPSLYDDLELDCRLYFPRLRSAEATTPPQGFAIFAHPYAPLGGCFDDPVVQSVGSVLVRQGFVLATFNFREAEKSPGKTSWTGKAELGDYVSLYAFMLSFMNVTDVARYVKNGGQPLLLLGGYSYGAMMTAHLPSTATVLSIIQNAKDGSSEREIERRSHELAQAFLGYCETQHQRGRSSLKPSDAVISSGVVVGGYESTDAARRISRESSRRSIDAERVRHSMERVRRKLGSRAGSSQDIGPRAHTSSEEYQQMQVVPELSFLLISPLLGTVSNFTTLFSKLKFERRARIPSTQLDQIPKEALVKAPTLVVFGTNDQFTSPRKVQRWCQSLAATPESKIVSKEVQGAGHFWHDPKIDLQLTQTVSSWLGSLSASVASRANT